MFYVQKYKLYKKVAVILRNVQIVSKGLQLLLIIKL